MKNKMSVRPILMQHTEPEYMCPECGYKFYIYDRTHSIDKCKYCGAQFLWGNVDKDVDKETSLGEKP